MERRLFALERLRNGRWRTLRRYTDRALAVAAARRAKAKGATVQLLEYGHDAPLTAGEIAWGLRLPLTVRFWEDAR